MKKRIFAIAAATLLGATALAGCGSSGGDKAAAEPVTLENMTGSWTFESGKGPEGDVKPVEGSPIEVTIEPDGTYTGTSGCNNMFGALTLEDGVLSTPPIGQTMMACEQPVLDAEFAFTQAFEAVDAGTVEGDALKLTGPDTELVFKKM